MACFVSKIYAVKFEVVEKTSEIRDCLAPNFSGSTTPKFSLQFISAIYLLPLAKFGWVLFAHLRVRSLATQQHVEFTEGD